MRFVFIGMILAFFVVGCEKKVTTNYELTPTFESNGYVFRGIEGKIGIQNRTLIAQEYQKVLWHFWGDPDEIKGKFRVEGTHLETDEKKPLLLISPHSNETTWEYEDNFTQANLGAIKTKPSALFFEKPGEWKINVFLDDTHFAELIVEVN